MNSERNIIMKLQEAKQLDEKTYTVGSTQYWRRNGKCYSWTATGGRKECSEDEYMRAISGDTSGGSVQNTEPHEDQARQSSEPNQVVANALGNYLPSDQFKRLSSEEKNACLDFAYKGVNVDKLSQRSKDIMIKGYDSFIKDRQRYANQAKRGQAPTPHSSDVDYWNTQISDANRMKDLLSPADNAVVSTPEKDPNLGKTVKLKGGRTGTIKTMDDLSVEEKREGTFGIVTIQGVKYDVYDSLWANGFASLVRREEPASKKEEPKTEVPAQDDYFGTSNPYRIGRVGNPERDMNVVGSTKVGATVELVHGDKSREYARKVGANTWKTDSGSTLSDNDIVSVAYDGGKATMNMMVKNNSKGVELDKGSKPEPKKEEPIPEPPKPVERERDHTDSAYVSYGNVTNFDHTSWDIDGDETTIQKTSDGRYYVQQGDFDLEFDTKGDLVNYLRQNDAEYVGDDSENDY